MNRLIFILADSIVKFKNSASTVLITLKAFNILSQD